MQLFLDLETYNETDIKAGTYRYAETAEVLMAAWAWDEEPVEVWDFTDGSKTVADLQMLIDKADSIVFHNSAFDRVVLKHQGVNVPLEKIIDTMALALAHALPAALGDLCEVLGLPQDKSKDKDGKKLIQLFSKPRPKSHKLRRADRVSHPEEWQRFIEYARMDVAATRYVLRRLPQWNNSRSEHGLWILDQRINDRGVAVDVELARSAIRAFQRSTGALAARSGELTNGAVGALTQRDKLLTFLRDVHGVSPNDLTKGTVRTLLQQDLNPQVRELLEIREQASATSPAKYKRLLQGVSSDGRLRGTLQYCGASRTGRWGGRLFQPQNLPRTSLKPHVIETGIAAMKADAEDLLFDNISELCSGAIRGAVIAAEGKKLVISDLSNIEGRVLAWVAGEDWKVRIFNDFDAGRSPDIYIVAYSRAFGVPVEDVTKDLRQIGKVMELALGYQGSVGAFQKMAEVYGVHLPEEEVLEIVKAWRKQHRATVSFWYDLERACKEAIWSQGDGFKVRDLSIRCTDDWLRIQLPSGRYLSYPDARVDDGKILYEGTDQYTRKWTTLDTYGGKLTENVVQAIARDVLASGMKRAEASGYEVCLHVHDELVTETPDTDEWSVDELSRLMTIKPGWATGLPLAAAGFSCYRYRKE